MANWLKNPPTGLTSRRRWNLEDRVSLNRLKTHFAGEYECPEIQFDLANELLNSSNNEKQDVNSQQQAVQWLVSASQQGHEDAAKLLGKCFTNGIGISPENEDEVHFCLSMTPGERAARKAARELFSCLSNGNEHITPKQLERRMRQIYNLQRKRRRRGTDDSATDEDDTSSELEHEPVLDAMTIGRPPHLEHNRGTSCDLQRYVITQANLVSAASNYAAGRMPSVSDALTLSVPHPQSLDHVPCFHRMIFHPVVFLTILYHRLINFACTLPAALPIGYRLLGLLLFVYFCSGEKSSNMLPIFSFYFSLTVMILSTCKMLKTKQEFVDFRIWSGLFLRYGDQNIEADISEHRFLRNNMKPYLYFFFAFTSNLIVYPLVSKEWLPHSELTIITGAFVFISLLAFMYGSTYHRFPDWIVIISFAVNVLAKYPYEMDEVVSNRWRFLDLHVPTFPSFVVGNGIEFCLTERTALYLMIPILLVMLAKRSNWHGVYSYLIPHCVTLSWLQICISTSQSATIFGVIRATLGLAGIVLFLPLFGIVSLLIPVFVAIDWMGFTNVNLKWSSTALVFLAASLLSCGMALNRVTQKYITIIQIIIGLFATSVLVFPYMTSNFKDSPRFNSITVMGNLNQTVEPILLDTTTNDISWNQYFELCAQPVSEQSNKVKTQIRCSHFNGISVSWKGTVMQVQIAQVSNIRDELITKYLPDWLGNLLRCLYGEPVNEQLACDQQDDNLCSEWIRVVETIKQQKGRCSLHRWNRYNYNIGVIVPSSGLLSKNMEIVLQANHEFQNFTHRLSDGDHIQFCGNIQSFGNLVDSERKVNVPGLINPPLINLKSIECLECKDPEILPISIERTKKSPVDARMKDLMRGIKYFLNALLNPLIIFK